MSIVFRAFLRGAFLFFSKAASSYSFGAFVHPVRPRGRAAAAALHPAFALTSPLRSLPRRYYGSPRPI